MRSALLFSGSHSLSGEIRNQERMDVRDAFFAVGLIIGSARCKPRRLSIAINVGVTLTVTEVLSYKFRCTVHHLQT